MLRYMLEYYNLHKEVPKNNCVTGREGILVEGRGKDADSRRTSS